MWGRVLRDMCVGCVECEGSVWAWSVKDMCVGRLLRDMCGVWR